MTDTECVDNLTFFTNPPPQAKSLLHSFEQAGRHIGLYVNADKTEFIYFNQMEPSPLEAANVKKSQNGW